MNETHKNINLGDGEILGADSAYTPLRGFEKWRELKIDVDRLERYGEALREYAKTESGILNLGFCYRFRSGRRSMD